MVATKSSSLEKSNHTPPKKTSPKDKGPKYVETYSGKQKEVVSVTTALNRKQGSRAQSKAMEFEIEKKKSVVTKIHTKSVTI